MEVGPRPTLAVRYSDAEDASTWWSGGVGGPSAPGGTSRRMHRGRHHSGRWVPGVPKWCFLESRNDGYMAGYYRGRNGFTFLRDATSPRWRPPQRGALGALIAHWAVHSRKHTLIAVPTGAGKTGIALAIPHLASPRRVLVVVPSTQLRKQLVEAFSSQAMLREADALSGDQNPRVLEVTGRMASWRDCHEFDVVVGLPQSISPEHYDDTSKPPEDLFDLVIVDEAHHSPARTWRAILAHFSAAQKVLLTATPRRRDGKRVPGELVFHYPLRSAIAEGFYQVVQARLLPVPISGDQVASDHAICAQIASELRRPEHATSTLLIRAGTRTRAKELVRLYEVAGIDVVALTSDLGERRQSEIIDGLLSGTIRAVAVVGMLAEGFDLPRLRLAAYHDKHKSVGSTIQLIGRLVRTHADYPQPSVLVTVLDADVYPALKGALWDLYQEDADWSTLLPGIIDEQAAADSADKEFSGQLEPAPPSLSPDALRPVVRATVYELKDGWQPPFIGGAVPEVLRRGATLRGLQIMYATVTPGDRTLLLITQGIRSPRWTVDSGLDAPEYDLHLVTFIPATATGTRGLLLVNSADGIVRSLVLEALESDPEDRQPADPERLQRAFDVLPRLSVSNVGVRNTYGGGRGTASYKMFAGSGVDRGLREADTAQAAIGHAMAQVSDGPGKGAYNTGFAVEKAKVWESRYVPLRAYDDLLADFADRYWSATPIANPLLPTVSRGTRLESYPDTGVAAIEMHPQLLASAWVTTTGFPVPRLDLRYDSVRAGGARLRLTAVRTDIDPETVVWSGELDIFGDAHDTSDPLMVRRGQQASRSFTELLSATPPTLFFANGNTVSGSTLYQPVDYSRDLSRWEPVYPDWSRTNITKETDRSAAKAATGESIHETLRRLLISTRGTARRRWVLENDGSGELSDLLVLEIRGEQEVRLELWHAKPAGGAAPSVRVADMQVVVAQAIKSRRWLTDRGVWQEMGARLSGKTAPALTVVPGSDNTSLLRALLGLALGHESWALANRPVILRGRVVIAQPGLSWGQLQTKVVSADLSAIQIRDLLASFDDALGVLGETALYCSP